jgi:serine/threonine-protein kinase
VWRSASHQHFDRQFDRRSDIFSIGVLLYYLLTGKYPFGLPCVELILRALHEPHTPLSAWLTPYPRALDGILDRALAKNPDDRYATAEEFAVDVDSVITEMEKDSVRG